MILTITELGIIIGLIGGVIGIVNGYALIKSRKFTPDKILDEHNQRIKDTEKCIKSIVKGQKVMLKAVKAILKSTAEGNNTGNLKQMEQEVDNFLLNRED
jgi:DNA-binding ferritin-like protein